MHSHTFMDKQIPELSKSQTGDFHGFTPSPYEDESEDEDRSFHFHPVHHRYSRERIPDSIHLAVCSFSIVIEVLVSLFHESDGFIETLCEFYSSLEGLTFWFKVDDWLRFLFEPIVIGFSGFLLRFQFY